MLGMMRNFAWSTVIVTIATVLASLLMSRPAHAGELNYSPIRTPLIAADWQPPSALPRVFRNHCHYDGEGRFYCSNHCGLDYQFYYCAPASFGCCRPGFGYCDWKGHLRCAPW